VVLILFLAGFFEEDFGLYIGEIPSGWAVGLAGGRTDKHYNLDFQITFTFYIVL